MGFDPLTHTSGIPDYADYEVELVATSTDEERSDIERRRTRNALGTFTRYTDTVAPLDNFKEDPLVFEPGTNWLYTSFGYPVLGCVLAGASSIVVLVPGQDFAIAILTNAKGSDGYLSLVIEIHSIIERNIAH